MNLKTIKKVYIVGISGVGTSALAVFFKQLGATVLGSDVPISKKTPTRLILSKENINVYESFNEKHITSDIDLVITPTLHLGIKNIEVQTAQNLGITCLSYAKCLGEIMKNSQTGISICGAHGKTTTTALFASVLTALNKKSGYIVGTSDFNNGVSGGGYTGSDYFVCEADEYVTDFENDRTPKFMYQHPDIAILLNIDFDHMDVYETYADVKMAFHQFISQVIERDKSIVYCMDNKDAHALMKDYQVGKIITYGLNKRALFQAVNIKVKKEKCSFDVLYKGRSLGHFTLQITGEHNVLNALSVIAVSKLLGFDLPTVARALSAFMPASRRMQKIYEGNVLYFDDYAHHPTEITATIKAIKMMYQGRRIIIVFQPHTYSRTSALLDDFLSALDTADQTFLLEIYGSVREKKPENPITSRDIEKKAREKGISSITYVSTENIYQKIQNTLKQGDILVTVGAGDQLFFMRNALLTIVKKIV